MNLKDDDYWVGKPHELVKARSPRHLAEQKVTVYAFSLRGGLRAAIEYMHAQGLSGKAILDNIVHHYTQSQHKIK